MSIYDDFEDFMHDSEGDPVSGANFKVCKNRQKMMAVKADDECGGVPRITLQEMLDDL